MGNFSTTIIGRSLIALRSNKIQLYLGDLPLGNINGRMKLESKLMKFNTSNPSNRIKFGQLAQNLRALNNAVKLNELDLLGIDHIDISKPVDTVKIWSEDLCKAFHAFFLEPVDKRQYAYRDVTDKFFAFVGASTSKGMKAYTLKVLSDVMQQHDHSTLVHQEQVAKYAVAIAQEMGLSKDEVEEIRMAAILHDIGKLGVSKQVLKKVGELTDDDLFRIHELHVNLGVDILKKIRWMSNNILEAIKYHHYLDGYPDNLDMEHVPLAAKIIAIADSFDAGTGGRNYAVKKTALQLYSELCTAKVRNGKVALYKGKPLYYYQPAVLAFGNVLRREGELPY